MGGGAKAARKFNMAGVRGTNLRPPTHGRWYQLVARRRVGQYSLRAVGDTAHTVWGKRECGDEHVRCVAGQPRELPLR